MAEGKLQLWSVRQAVVSEPMNLTAHSDSNGENLQEIDSHKY